MRTGEEGPGGGGGAVEVGGRYIDMGRLGSFEIGQRLEILIFWGWGDRLGVWDRYQGC